MKKCSILFIVLLIASGTIYSGEDLSHQLPPLLYQYNTIQNKLDTMEYHIKSINSHLNQVQQNKIGQLALNMISMMYNIGISKDNKKDRS